MNHHHPSITPNHLSKTKQLKAKAPSLKLTLGCSTFVPKSHTPFQWYGVDKAADKRLTMLDKALGKMGVQFRPESYKWSVMQVIDKGGGVVLAGCVVCVAARSCANMHANTSSSTPQALLSRGDRRLTPLLLLVREYGDSLGSFKRAFKELKGTLPPLEYYVHETYAVGETMLPWHHLHGPLPEATLVKHNADAQAEMGGVMG